jgi:DNA-binding NarL/FixJ family response regulator
LTPLFPSGKSCWCPPLLKKKLDVFLQAPDGTSGLKTLSHQVRTVDVVCCDLGMPHMNDLVRMTGDALDKVKINRRNRVEKRDAPVK